MRPGSIAGPDDGSRIEFRLRSVDYLQEGQTQAGKQLITEPWLKPEGARVFCVLLFRVCLFMIFLFAFNLKNVI